MFRGDEIRQKNTHTDDPWVREHDHHVQLLPSVTYNHIITEAVSYQHSNTLSPLYNSLCCNRECQIT